jgi:hypothetical protein
MLKRPFYIMTIPLDTNGQSEFRAILVFVDIHCMPKIYIREILKVLAILKRLKNKPLQINQYVVPYFFTVEGKNLK